MADLNAAGQHLVEDVGPLLHDAHVLLSGVGTLAVLDGVDESVPELLHGAQQVLLDEVHHAVVWWGGRRGWRYDENRRNEDKLHQVLCTAYLGERANNNPGMYEVCLNTIEGLKL